MLVSMIPLLRDAGQGGYAIGAFNVYNLEGVQAVVAAAEAMHSPAILQIHPSALRYGGSKLVALCLAAAGQSTVPISVHLDHSASADAIRVVLAAGMPSIMADGSHLPYQENVAFTSQMVELAHAHDAVVEAELGRLSGTEDGLTVPEIEAKFTDPHQAVDFVQRTHVDALAVCIGNVHGHYPGEPQLDFNRLSAIRDAVSVPLVLHGASGLPESMVARAISLGITKLNVNTEVRSAYLRVLKERMSVPQIPELLDLMRGTTEAMQTVITEKLRLFGSIGKAQKS